MSSISQNKSNKKDTSKNIDRLKYDYFEETKNKVQEISKSLDSSDSEYFEKSSYIIESHNFLGYDSNINKFIQLKKTKKIHEAFDQKDNNITEFEDRKILIDQKKLIEYTSLKNEIKEINELIFSYAINNPSPESSFLKPYEERIKYLISVQKKDEKMIIDCFDLCYCEKIKEEKAKIFSAFKTKNLNEKILQVKNFNYIPNKKQDSRKRKLSLFNQFWSDNENELSLFFDKIFEVYSALLKSEFLILYVLKTPLTALKYSSELYSILKIRNFIEIFMHDSLITNIISEIRESDIFSSSLFKLHEMILKINKKSEELLDVENRLKEEKDKEIQSSNDVRKCSNIDELLMFINGDDSECNKLNKKCNKKQKNKRKESREIETYQYLNIGNKKNYENKDDSIEKDVEEFIYKLRKNSQHANEVVKIKPKFNYIGVLIEN